MTQTKPFQSPGARGIAPSPAGFAPAPRVPAPADGTPTLARALADYVRAVAEAVGVPGEGTTWEVTDTATAYLALGCRSAAHPDRDAMLVWSSAQGWVISIETTPAEPPIVLARSTGDPVPAPGAVARFVTESLARRGDRRALAVLAPPADWSELAERMARHTR